MRALATLLALLVAGCDRPPSAAPVSPSATRPSILLVTLDTTRADALGPGAAVPTPRFDALAARGQSFTRAYTSAPETLPAHASILTGLLPAGHGVHENGRTLGPDHAVLAEELSRAGYETAAFVSAWVLARRFGLARGFDHYDDALGAEAVERTADRTTEQALAFLARRRDRPLFLWVHYFDPHAPYAPPATFHGARDASAYHREVAFMDGELGRLVEAFERSAPAPRAIAVVGDHGEGLGDHGEEQHGHLAYDSTMRVPLVLVGPGTRPGVSDVPVASRRLFATLLHWAGRNSDPGLLSPRPEPVVGEAMKPFLSYGWQPQVMAVEGRHKAILAGGIEAYDVVADPGETRPLGPQAPLSRALRDALREYPVPVPGAVPATAQDDEARRKLASLGYVAGGATPVVRKDAPRPADMTELIDVIEKASGHFVREEWAEAIPLLRRVREKDPGNLDAALRLGAAHSARGEDRAARAAFDRAAEIAPASIDVKLYRALHEARAGDPARAATALGEVLAVDPDRLPALEALAALHERHGRIAEAVALVRRVHALREPAPADLLRLGEMAMAARQTDAAIGAFEAARARQGAAFRHDLELGVLYLAARRLAEARDALDRVPAGHPARPMALFKRAQVAVLMGERDRAEHIARARAHADDVTRPLIARERLFDEP